MGKYAIKFKEEFIQDYLGRPLIQSHLCILIRSLFHTHEDQGKDWNEASISQEIPGGYQKLKEARNGTQNLWWKCSSADTMILDFWPSEM